MYWKRNQTATEVSDNLKVWLETHTYGERKEDSSQ